KLEGVQLEWRQVLSKETPIDLPLLASLAAIAGVGGLNNTSFAAYARDKGWGMGGIVGAIPSMIGGKGIALSHTGAVFPMTEENLRRWRRWRSITLMDQFGVWVVGCILGMGIPALVSLQFVRGQEVSQNTVAAMTAAGVADGTGIPFLWWVTLFCGFVVLAPSQITSVDGFTRRWTDVLWSANPRMSSWPGDKVVYVYYSILGLYFLTGIVILTVFPKPFFLVKAAGVLVNYALSAAALHTLIVNTTLLPKPVRPNMLYRAGLLGCSLFFLMISAVSTPQILGELSAILWPVAAK
ncbi:MAG: Nramp family divalent metal transporter, partial [Planctomycetia bacterium]